MESRAANSIDFEPSSRDICKFEFGKNDRARSPGLYRSQWHEQINNMQLFFW